MNQFDPVDHYTSKLPHKDIPTPSKPPILHLHSKRTLYTPHTPTPKQLAGTLSLDHIHRLQQSFTRMLARAANVQQALRTASLVGAVLRVRGVVGTVVGESRTALMMSVDGCGRIMGKKGNVFVMEWDGEKYFLVGRLMDVNRMVKRMT